MTLIPKFMGRDDELSTTGSVDERSIDSWNVTQKILAQLDAVFESRGVRAWTRRSTSGGSSGQTGGWSSGGWSGWNSAWSTDCLRHWISNGQSYYSDMGHVEACTASTLHPQSFAAQCLSTLVAAEEARARAQDVAPRGTRYSLSAANVDIADPGIAWGTHVNVSISNELFSDLFLDARRPAVLGYVASALAAAIPFFGCGYLMPVPKRGDTIFSLSARAHHLTKISTLRTTEAWHRGILNERQESHADGQDRLHLIGFDFCLGGATLMSSFLQCLLAAAEEGFCGLNLYEPVRALRTWSWTLDPRTTRLTGKAVLTDGRQLTLPGYVAELTRALLHMCETGLIPESVAPGARELYLPRILELCGYLEAGELARCAPHLDWAAKLMVLMDLQQREGWDLGDGRMRLADHDYANTDPARGAFWKLWEAGQVDPLVEREAVDACLVEGPPESRDWGRGKLIERFHDDITDVDWSYVELERGEGRWNQRLKIELPVPGSMGRERLGPLLDDCVDADELEERLEAAEASRVDPLLENPTEGAGAALVGDADVDEDIEAEPDSVNGTVNGIANGGDTDVDLDLGDEVIQE